MKLKMMKFMAAFVFAGLAGAFIAAAAADSQYATAVVEQGDTLYGLARRHYQSAARWRDIAKLNNLTPPYELVDGQTLLLPDSRPVQIRAPVAMEPAIATGADSEPHSPEMVTTEVSRPASQPAFSVREPRGHDETESLEGLLELVRSRNREILAARSFAEAADARIKPAGSLDDPALSFGYQEGMGLDNFPSIGDDIMSHIFITIEQMFPGPGKRALRREIAEHMWKHKDAEVDAVRLKVEAKVRRIYWEIYRIDSEREILERTRENLRSLALAAAARYAAGEGNQEDVIRAGLEVSMTTERLRMLIEERSGMTAELNALLDRDAGSPVRRPVPAGVHGIVPMNEMKSWARTSCPLIIALQHVVMHEEAAVRLADAERLPDWGVMAGVMPRGSLPAMWTVGFKITLPIRKGERQDEWKREADANLAASQHQLEGHWREVEAGLSSRYATTESARELVALYDHSIIPQAELAFRSAAASYGVGRADFMTVIANMVAVRQYEVERARRLAEFHQAVAEIEALVAHPIAVERAGQAE